MSKAVLKRNTSSRGLSRANGSAAGMIPLSAAERILGMSVPAARDRYAKLTDRERQVASLMAAGMRNRQIAENLDISPKTLDIHRANAMHKLEAETTARLANLVNLLRLADTARG
jgi:FixJ family two-component response regulator